MINIELMKKISLSTLVYFIHFMWIESTDIRDYN